DRAALPRREGLELCRLAGLVDRLVEAEEDALARAFDGDLELRRRALGLELHVHHVLALMVPAERLRLARDWEGRETRGRGARLFAVAGHVGFDGRAVGRGNDDVEEVL